MEQIHTHISRQFNAELEDIRTRVLQMGGLVELQIDQAINALVNADTALAEKVVTEDYKVNKMEVDNPGISAQAIAEKLDITQENVDLLYKLVGQFKKNLRQKRVAALC